MNREAAYISCIPEQAREKVTQKHEDGSRKRSEYYVGKELVGVRTFHVGGVLEGEWAFRNGNMHGWQYRWDMPGELLSATPYADGLPHGTAYQWASDGRMIGSYTMERGTGIDLWWQDWSDGTVDLSEVLYFTDGLRHGFEWWLYEKDRLSIERHWLRDVLNGIEREWNFKGGLRRGFPRYWVQGERVTKPQYLRAAARDSSLPAFRPEDNQPYRDFPPEIALHLRRTQP